MNRLRRALAGAWPHIFLTLLCFAVLEIAVRSMCHTDEDGEYRFRLTRLKPYHMPLKRVEKELLAYRDGGGAGVLYDPELGWALRPGINNHNTAGFVTTGPVPDRVGTPGTLRIALLGDSYTQGEFRTGWWRVLEEKMNAAGAKTEVLNFGVGAYGIDQAYLRWHRDCAPWKPDIVIFGFMVDGCVRDLNLLRMLRDPDSGVPFMKPRFTPDGDGLKLVNSPTPDPREIAAILRNFAGWPSSRHEYFFNAADYRMTWWRHSRFAALVEARLTHSADLESSKHFFDPDGDAGQIAVRILRRMRTEVEASGAVFYVALLPCPPDIESLSKGDQPLQSELYDKIGKEFSMISLERPVAEAAAGMDLDECFPESHYNESLNAVIGAKVAAYLLEQRKPGAPAPRN